MCFINWYHLVCQAKQDLALRVELAPPLVMLEGVMSRLIDHYDRGGIREPRSKCTVPRTPSEMAPEECGVSKKQEEEDGWPGTPSLCPSPKLAFSPPSYLSWKVVAVQSLSHLQLFLTPWTAARQASLSFASSRSLLKLMSIQSVMPFNHLILCHPLLLRPSIFPSIKVFSNESVLCIRWPKYWSFNFSISPSNEYSELISFRIDWFELHEKLNYIKLESDANMLQPIMLDWELKSNHTCGFSEASLWQVVRVLPMWSSYRVKSQKWCVPISVLPWVR